MTKSIIVSPSYVSDDHILVKLKIGFKLDSCDGFAEGVFKLIETTSYGGKGIFKSERKEAREEYQIKIIGFENDDANTSAGNEYKGRIQIAIPLKICTPKQGIPHFLSTLMYASVYSFITEFHVTDIHFPDAYLKHFPQPKYGIDLFTDDEDHLRIGLILKPRSIINAKIANELIVKAVKAGIHYIADDELTIDPPEWRFVDRIKFITTLLAKLKTETGRKTKYIANISGGFESSMKLAKLAEAHGVDGVMVNTITMGYDVVQALAKSKSFRPFIVANVIGRNLMSGGPKYLLADHIHSFLARLSGADAIYTGPFVGTINSRQEKASHFEWALTDNLSKKHPVKKTYAVMSGGLEPKNLLENYRVYSSPVMFSIGLSLCNLIEQDISIEKVVEIIKTVFRAEKNGGAEQVKNDITELASKHQDYLTILKQLKWT